MMSRKSKLMIAIIAIAYLGGASAVALPGMDLAPAQKTEMRALSQSTRQQTQILRGTLADRHMKLMKVYSEYSLNADRARSLNREINDLQSRLLNVNLESQLGVRKTLNRERFAEFNRMMQRQRPKHGRHGMFEDGKGVPFGQKEVERFGLSEPQRSDMKQLWMKSKERPIAAVETVKAKSADLEALYQNYDLDEQKARAIIRDLNNAQKRLLEARLQMQTQLRQTLAEDQFNRLRDAMAEKMRNMQQHRGRHGPPPPGSSDK